MKVKTEIKNGFIIFISIGTFFLLMEFLGLSHLFYLRLLNVFFVLYGVNATLKSRIAEGKKKFVSNAVATIVTSVVGVALSILGLLIYSYMRGGDAYIHNLSKTFLFGGDPSINTYCFTLFFEGMASSVVVALLLMLYYNDKFTAD